MALTDVKVRSLKGKNLPYKVSDSEGHGVSLPCKHQDRRYVRERADLEAEERFRSAIPGLGGFKLSSAIADFEKSSWALRNEHSNIS
jgi:hypothetical protein